MCFQQLHISGSRTIGFHTHPQLFPAGQLKHDDWIKTVVSCCQKRLKFPSLSHYYPMEFPMRFPLRLIGQRE